MWSKTLLFPTHLCCADRTPYTRWIGLFLMILRDSCTTNMPGEAWRRLSCGERRSLLLWQLDLLCSMHEDPAS